MYDKKRNLQNFMELYKGSRALFNKLSIWFSEEKSTLENFKVSQEFELGGRYFWRSYNFAELVDFISFLVDSVSKLYGFRSEECQNDRVEIFKQASTDSLEFLDSEDYTDEFIEDVELVAVDVIKIAENLLKDGRTSSIERPQHLEGFRVDFERQDDLTIY